MKRSCRRSWASECATECGHKPQQSSAPARARRCCARRDTRAPFHHPSVILRTPPFRHSCAGRNLHPSVILRTPLSVIPAQAGTHATSSARTRQSRPTPTPFPNSSLPPLRREVRWGVGRCEPTLPPCCAPSVIPAQAGTYAVDAAQLGTERSAAARKRLGRAGGMLRARTGAGGRPDSRLRRNDGRGASTPGVRRGASRRGPSNPSPCRAACRRGRRAAGEFPRPTTRW